MNIKLRIALGVILVMTITCFTFALVAPAFSTCVEISKSTIVNTISDIISSEDINNGQSSSLGSFQNFVLTRLKKGITETMPDDFSIPIYNGKFSILSGIIELFKGNLKDCTIATIIILFSILFPLIKFQIYFNALLDNSLKRYESIILWFSKFSMIDVFVLSLMLMMIKDIPQTEISFSWGFYAYSASVILNILLGCIIENVYNNKANIVTQSQQYISR